MTIDRGRCSSSFFPSRETLPRRDIRINLFLRHVGYRMSTKKKYACRAARPVSRDRTTCFTGFRMRWLTLSLLIVGMAPLAGAHHPDREHHPVWPRIDLIPPLGYNLPMGYRRRFNRPTKIGGWIAYHIAPSSQEAMAWHDAAHQNAYSDHRGRLEKHFFCTKRLN